MRDPAVLLIGTVVALPFLVAAVQAFQYRHRPGMSVFVVLSLLLALLPIPVAFLWLGAVENPDAIRRALFALYTFVQVCWLVFVFDYVGRGPTMTRPRVALVVGFGAATAGGVLLFPLFEGTVLGVALFLNGIFQTTLFATVGYATFLVFRAVILYDDLPRGDATLLLVVGTGLITLTLIQVLTPEIPPQLLQGPQLLVLWVVGLTAVVTQWREDAFESGPSAGHLARETIFDEMSGAAIITDENECVLDCNEPAVDLFGSSRAELLGTDLSVLFDGVDTVPEGQPAVLNTMKGQREFDVSVSSLTNSRGERLGTAYVLEDLTDRRTHEQRLEVLNRILRHNLRNDLDAIQGFAEALEHGDDAPELAARIEDSATDLAALGETVGKAERLLARDESDWRRVDLVAAVEGLTGSFRDRFPDASIQFETDSSELLVETDQSLLTGALEEVIDNALEHTDNEQPQVRITLETAPPCIEVSDNGPGIPARERAVLLDGEERPLRHGSGIGLWFVHWALAALGGTLDLRENDPRGTVVTLQFPDAVRLTGVEETPSETGEGYTGRQNGW
jgi:signal transduction histidine kinase